MKWYVTGTITMILAVSLYGLNQGTAFAADDSPQAFTIQGELTNSAGTASLTDSNVQITVGIYGPAGTCLLYEETQTGIDLSTTSGVFAIQVGSATGDSKRTSNDPGLTMAQVFANAGTQIRAAGANCASGYTPAAGDVRKLRFTVDAASLGGAVTLTPDQTLGSVPQAIVAQTLQGLDPSKFIQTNSSANLSQATVETLTNGSDASTLHNHDSLYVKIGSGGSQNIGSGSFYTSGSVGVGTLVAPSGTQMQVDTTSSTTKGIVVKGSASQSANLLELDNSSGTQLLGVDGLGNLTVGTGNIGIGTTTPTSLLSVVVPNNSLALGITQSAASTGYSFIRSKNTGGDALFGVADSTGTTSLNSGVAYSTVVGSNNSTPLQLMTNGTARITINSSGNVGIGTNNPGNLFVADTLTVNSVSHAVQIDSTRTNQDLNVGTYGIYSAGGVTGHTWFTSEATGAPSFVLNSSGTNWGLLQNNSTGVWSLGYGASQSALGTSVLTWNTSGNVGIGTTSPTYTLDVNGKARTTASISGAPGSLAFGTIHTFETPSSNALTAYGIQFSNTSTTKNANIGLSVSNASTYGEHNNSLYFDSPGDFVFHSNSADNFVISNSGKVGIGVQSPTALLQLKAGTATAGTAPLKFTSGTNLSTPEAGAVEYDGTNLYFTDSTATRRTLATTSSVSSSYLPLTGGTLSGAVEVDGSSIFKNGSNSTTAYQFLDSSGGNAVTIDTTTDQLSVGVGGIKIKSNNNTASGTLNYNSMGFNLDSSIKFLGGNTIYGSTSNADYIQIGSYGTVFSTIGTANGNGNALSLVAPTFNPTIANTYTDNLLYLPGTMNSTGAATFRGIYVAPTDNSSSITNTIVGIYSDVSGGSNTSASRYSGIFTGGNVGIGTTTPGAMLHVSNGDIATDGGKSFYAYGNGTPGAANATWASFYGTSTQSRFITAGIGTYSSSVPDLVFDKWDGTTVGTLMTIKSSSGNVGIGNTSPSSRLTVGDGTTYEQAIHINALTAPVIRFQQAGVNKMGIVGGDTLSIYDYTHSSWRLTVNDLGNVGIGNSSPGYKLDVNGDVNIASASSLLFGGVAVCTSTGCTSSSDERLKENIKPLENSLEKVLQLQGVEYDYKDKTKFTDKHQIGVIAQDVEKVFPEVVVTDKKTTLKSVAYDHLVAPLIESVKALFARIVAIEGHQEGTDLRIKKLEAENAELKAYICQKDPKASFCK